MAVILQTDTLYLDEEDIKPKYKRTIETVNDKLLLLKCLKQTVQEQVINADIIIYKVKKKDIKLIKTRY